MQIPIEIRRAIRAMHHDSLHVLRVGHNEYPGFVVTCCVRQGCPMSPYLFVVLMTVLMRDAHIEAGEERRSEVSGLLGNTEALYADDTLLIGKSARTINIVLGEIELGSEKYLRYFFAKIE